MINREYYTPKIEDLFVGYECEYRAKSYQSKDKTEWHPWKEIVCEESFMARGCSESYYPSDIEIRTKYLDKEDIESLGFKYDEKKEEFISNKTYLGIGIGDDKKIHIFYDEYRRLTIYYQENRGEVHVVFDGKCTSINELKKIMSYLNITNE